MHIPVSAQNTTLPHLGADIRPPAPERRLEVLERRAWLDSLNEHAVEIGGVHVCWDGGFDAQGNATFEYCRREGLADYVPITREEAAELLSGGPTPPPERNVPLTIQPDGTIGRQGISPEKHDLICALQIAYTLDALENPSTPEAFPEAV